MNELLLNNDLTVLNNFLQHTGEKGMRWGVFGASGATRYQNHAVYAKGAPRYANENYGDVYKQLLARNIKNLPNGGLRNITDLSSNAKRITLAKFAEHADKMNDKRMKRSAIDSETGLRLKQSDSSMEEDMKHVNPGYNDFNTNTKNNCVLCSAAYEMRRRGYDVAAVKDGGDGYTFEYVMKLFPKADLYQLSRENTAVKEFNKNIGDGIRYGATNGNSRGLVVLEFKDGAGHAMSYEMKNNKITYLDSQRNMKFSESSIEKLLRNVESFDYARLDNVDFDLNTIKEAVR